MTSFWPLQHPVAQYGELLEVKKMHKLDIVTWGGFDRNICFFFLNGWVDRWFVLFWWGWIWGRVKNCGVFFFFGGNLAREFG